MATGFLATPAPTSPANELLDWLELEAFLSGTNVARLDVLVSALEMQLEEPSEEIEAEDDFKEALVAEIENEYDFRRDDCIGSYPFLLSDDAEELFFVGDPAHPNTSVYLVCLLASHLIRSPFVTLKGTEEDLTKIVTDLRNSVFQVISTVAMAGLADGPSISIGWPRSSDETILQALARGVPNNSSVVPRANPNPAVKNPWDKDGGMDVISWRDGKRHPPLNFYFGQVASGADWAGKAAMGKARSFKEKYVDSGPLCNEDYATLMPFRVSDTAKFNSEHSDHRTILDRTRLPQMALKGIAISENGIPVDEVENFAAVEAWIFRYKGAAAG